LRQLAESENESAHLETDPQSQKGYA
jgi:hypothetical protein